MIVGAFLINEYGDILVRKPIFVSKHPWSPEAFYKRVVKNVDKEFVAPCVRIEKIYYIHSKKNDVYIAVAIESKKDVSSILMIECMNDFIVNLCDLIGDITSKNVMHHIAVVYEMVIKSFGLGYPQKLTPQDIRDCKLMGDTEPVESSLMSYLPSNLFGLSPSREEKYTKEGSASRAPLASKQREKSKEIFVDLIENLVVLVDDHGKIIKAELKGDISSKNFLVHPVSLQISLKDCVMKESSSSDNSEKIIISDKYFHVLLKDDEDKQREKEFPLINHVSNPGHSRIMSYHIDSKEIPFTMYHNFAKAPRGGMTEVTFNCKLHCALPSGISATNFNGKFLLPSNLHSVKAISSLQSMKFSEDDKHKVLTFEAPIFPAQSYHSVTVTLLLTKLLPITAYEMPRLDIQFDVPDLCLSNMDIKGLKVKSIVSNTTETIHKWVRRSTHCKDYQFILNWNWLDVDEMLKSVE